MSFQSQIKTYVTYVALTLSFKWMETGKLIKVKNKND